MNIRFEVLKGESWTSGYKKKNVPFLKGRQGSRFFARDVDGGFYFKRYIRRLQQEMIDYQSEVHAQHAIDRHLNRNLQGSIWMT
jgi:hypothetical protein